MMPINTFFWMMIAVFALVGAMRGWDRESLVTFSVIVALFLRMIFITYVPILRDFLNSLSPVGQFHVYSLLILLMAFVGYAGPVLSTRLSPKASSRKLQDIILGCVIGALNGYLIVGSIWYFLHNAGYGQFGILPPPEGSVAYVIATTYLPPAWLSPVVLFITVALSFVFVLIVQL
ncbi:MAG: hypothetical protein N2508_12975 [Anaerolineae bacterium]|nr:hypothetical protein [Anaerolineae bacterium]